MCSLWHFPRMSVCVLDGTVLFFLDVMRRFISFPWYQSVADRESLGRNYTKKRSTLCPSIWFCRLWLISFEFPTNWAEIMMPSHLVCLSLASSQQIFLIEFRRLFFFFFVHSTSANAFRHFPASETTADLNQSRHDTREEAIYRLFMDPLKRQKQKWIFMLLNAKKKKKLNQRIKWKGHVDGGLFSPNGPDKMPRYF